MGSWPNGGERGNYPHLPHRLPKPHRHRRPNLVLPLIRRRHEGELPRMEAGRWNAVLFPQAVTRGVAVRPVAENGMANGGQMHADLVRAARREVAPEKGTAFPSCKNLVGAPRLPALPPPHDRHLRRTQRVPTNGRIDNGAGMRRNASDKRKVHFSHAAPGKLPLQCLVRRWAFREEEAARRIFVETMRENGIVMEGETPLPQEKSDAAEKRCRSRLHPRAVMHGNARGFIDDEAGRVFVENRKMEIDREDFPSPFQRERDRVRVYEHYFIPDTYGCGRLLHYPPTNPNQSTLNHSLRLRPTPHAALLHEETIEAAARLRDE